MKKIFFAALTTLLLLSSCNEKRTDKMEETFKIDKGLNLSHWLSQSEKRGEERQNYITAKDLKTIAEMKFDHIRFPIDEEQMWNEDGSKVEEAFELLHKGIGWALENNLNVIVDLHVLRSHHFNNPDSRKLWEDKTAQENFISFWKQLSSELKKYPNNRLAYEPLNEAVAENPEDWNKLINWVVSEIRKLEPKRTIIMGSNRWQTVGTFKDLQIPKNDKNIILSFHYYEPFILTHYKTSWSTLKNLDAPINYPGQLISEESYSHMDKEYAKKIKTYNQKFSVKEIEDEIKQAVEVANKAGLKLYCGEFGAFPSTDIKLRVKWYKDMMEVFNKYNIAWCHWNYKNDFPVVDSNLKPIKEIIDVLVPAK